MTQEMPPLTDGPQRPAPLVDQLRYIAEKMEPTSTDNLMLEAADAIERLQERLAVAERVVSAACQVVAADTYKHPILTRAEAVEQGVAELHDAVGKWLALQPAGQSIPTQQ